MVSDFHPGDEQLVLLLDTPIPPGHHVTECPRCQERMRELRDTLVAVRRTVRPAPRRPSRHWLWIAAAAAVLAILSWCPPGSFAGPRPDPRLTPGLVRTASVAEVCALPHGDDGRRVTAERAARVFERYGIARPGPREYEVDYLISPSLGGADDERNQWPLAYAAGTWTSRVKDALEDHLRREVCDGRFPLSQAQQEIARDWIAAYQRHFGSRAPVQEHARFVKDSPWP